MSFFRELSVPSPHPTPTWKLSSPNRHSHILGTFQLGKIFLALLLARKWCLLTLNPLEALDLQSWLTGASLPITPSRGADAGLRSSTASHSHWLRRGQLSSSLKPPSSPLRLFWGLSFAFYHTQSCSSLRSPEYVLS